MCDDRREKLKNDKEEAVEKGFRFKPHKTRRPMKDATNDNDVSLLERLHHEADNKIAVREKAKRALEEAEMAEYSFTPCINPASHKLLQKSNQDSRPIHERVAEIQRQKKESLQMLRMESEQNDPNCTFTPQVNKSSRCGACS